jgi:hypothetical protein
MTTYSFMAEVDLTEGVDPARLRWPDAMCSGHRHLPRIGTDGHRSRWVRNELIVLTGRLYREHGTRTSHCGLAIGTDQDWGSASDGAGMDLHAHIPFPQQADGWPIVRQQEWMRLRKLAVTETVYGDPERVGVSKREQECNRLFGLRNDGMIGQVTSRPGVAVCVWDGRKTGGTWDVVKKLHRGGPDRKSEIVPVIWINPAEQTIRRGIPGELINGPAATPAVEQDGLW